MSECDDIKFRRAYSRCIIGCKAPGELVFVTLTTWPGMKVPLWVAWQRFTARLRRINMLPAYYAVREWNKSGTCEHLHVIMRINHMLWYVVRLHWSIATGYAKDISRNRCKGLQYYYNWQQPLLRVQIIAAYGHARNMANYLAKYLTKSFESVKLIESYGRPERGRNFWYSFTWIFRGWRAMSRLCYRFGVRVDFEYWTLIPAHDLPFEKVKAVLGLWRRHRTSLPPWSISLAKDLRRCGVITTRLDWHGL